MPNNLNKIEEWEFECVTDADNFGQITIQKGRLLKNGLVLLQDDTIVEFESLKNIFNNPELELGLWADYNPILKKWRKIGNIKTLKKNEKRNEIK